MTSVSVPKKVKSQSFSPYIESNKIRDSENVVSSKKHTHVSNKNILRKEMSSLNTVSTSRPLLSNVLERCRFSVLSWPAENN